MPTAASTTAPEPEWMRLLQCVICLETTRHPMRPWHAPPLHHDCGVVLCPDCLARWRAMPRPVCPKCRADVVCLGHEGPATTSAPIVGGAARPDPLLSRLIAELLPAEGGGWGGDPSPTKAVAAPGSASAPTPSPPPPVPATTHRSPVTLTHMRAILRPLPALLGVHPGRDGGEGGDDDDDDRGPWWPGGRRPGWTDRIVTTTTLVVDDADAIAHLPALPGRDCDLGDLDRRLQWSRRLGVSPERTWAWLHALGRHLPWPPASPPTGGGDLPPWEQGGGSWLQPHTVDVRGVWFLRTAVAALVALRRYVRDQPRDRDAAALAAALERWGPGAPAPAAAPSSPPAAVRDPPPPRSPTATTTRVVRRYAVPRPRPRTWA